MKLHAALLGIIVIILFVAYHYSKPPEHTGFEKGDRVKITDSCFEMNCWYAQCKKLTYLSGQTLDRNASKAPVHVAWILAEECPWYQYPDIGMTTNQAVVTMKIKEIERE